MPSYEEFVNLLQSQYPNYHPELVLKYVDKEGDKIAVTTQIEWEEMIDELKGEKVIKLYITEGQNPNGYFKDGPVPEALHVYTDSKEPIDNSNLIEEFKIAVPKCLESLFRDNKIIPSHIPSFLKDAIQLKYHGPQNVDMDIDVYKLYDLLFDKSLECLKCSDKESIMKGRDYLIAMARLQPENYLTLYNLACAESLLNNIPEAVKILEQAISAGFTNLEHLKEDKDLDNIRNTEGYKNLVLRLENRSSTFVPLNEDGCNGYCEGCSCCDMPSQVTFNDDYDDIYFDEGSNTNAVISSQSLCDDPVVLDCDCSLVEEDDIGVDVCQKKESVESCCGDVKKEMKKEEMKKEEVKKEEVVSDSFAGLKGKWAEKNQIN